MAVRQPLLTALRIIELRQYARVKQACESASREDQVPKGMMAELVFEVQHELLKARKIKITK